MHACDDSSRKRLRFIEFVSYYEYMARYPGAAKECNLIRVDKLSLYLPQKAFKLIYDGWDPLEVTSDGDEMVLKQFIDYSQKFENDLISLGSYK